MSFADAFKKASGKKGFGDDKPEDEMFEGEEEEEGAPKKKEKGAKGKKGFAKAAANAKKKAVK